MSRATRMLFFAGVTVAAVLCASTANASGPIRLGDPSPEQSPIPAEFLPTAAETAAMALSDWLEEHPSAAGKGGVAISDDLTKVNVYWKGTAPPDLESLATTQPAPVSFRSAAYSNNELSATSQMLIDYLPGMVTSAGPNQDWSGVVVTLKSSAPANTMTLLSSATTTPITSLGADEPEPAARNNDYAPWFGGSLITGPQTCTTGVAAYAGPYSYVTTAYHCGSGTFYNYDSPRATVGAVTARNAAHDIQVIRTSSNYFIWDGAWNSGTASAVYRAAAPVLNMRVWLSGGISGVPVFKRYIRFLGRYYSLGSAQPRVGPAFIFMEGIEGCGTGGCGGVFTQGDSGSPVFRYTSAGKKEVFGFMSASYGLRATFCDANKRPGFVCGWARGYAVYALDAMASMGLHAKTG
ncbi:hypothetical protein ACFPJ1_16995 [Kribbella qitaiheensis]|uniref:hypothetical protein n=1 Tax=Kribbella qitaiheensis TaxID=1544730 RepID=UPI00360AB99C